MNRQIYRLLFVLFVLAGSLRMFAQSNEIAVTFVSPRLADSTVVDDGDSIDFEFEESLGYGFSFNRFWTQAFSTELALQKYDADLRLGDSLGGPMFEVGQLDVTSLTATGQWHFNRAGRFSPYVGAGIAHLSGELELRDIVEPATQTVDLESELTWTASAGANVRLTESIALTGELKYSPWNANEENAAPEDAVEVNPLALSAGVRFRF